MAGGAAIRRDRLIHRGVVSTLAGESREDARAHRASDRALLRSRRGAEGAVDNALAALAKAPGVGVAELRQIVDHRGAVLHMLRSDAPDFRQFGECYFSEVAPGAI